MHIGVLNLEDIKSCLATQLPQLTAEFILLESKTGNDMVVLDRLVYELADYISAIEYAIGKKLCSPSNSLPRSKEAMDTMQAHLLRIFINHCKRDKKLFRFIPRYLRVIDLDFVIAMEILPGEWKMNIAREYIRRQVSCSFYSVHSVRIAKKFAHEIQKKVQLMVMINVRAHLSWWNIKEKDPLS
jgi:hypothetical protein